MKNGIFYMIPELKKAKSQISTRHLPGLKKPKAKFRPPPTHHLPAPKKPKANGFCGLGGGPPPPTHPPFTPVGPSLFSDYHFL